MIAEERQSLARLAGYRLRFSTSERSMRPFNSVEAVRTFVEQHGEERLIELMHTPGALSRTERGYVTARQEVRSLSAKPSRISATFKIVSGMVFAVVAGLVVAYLSHLLHWI